MFNYDYEEQLFKNSELKFVTYYELKSIYRNEKSYDDKEVNFEFLIHNSEIGLLCNEKYYFDFKKMEIKPTSLYKDIIRYSHETYKNFNHFLKHKADFIMRSSKYNEEYRNLLKLIIKYNPEFLIN